METSAVYYNFLTDSIVEDDVLSRLRGAQLPAPGQPIQLDEMDLFSYRGGQPAGGAWKVVDMSGATNSMRGEWYFLSSIGAAIEQPEGRFLAWSPIVETFYGPQESALFAGEGAPTEGKLQRTAQFLKAEVLPLYVARAQRLLPSIPDTTYDGIQLRANLRDLQLLIRALEARFSAPPAEVAAP
jgi:hypothetical protein